MSVAEDLRAARALIVDPKDWCQGTGKAGNRRCALFAVRDVVTGPWVANPAVKALRSAVPPGYGGVVSFNDALNTTHAMVLDWFDAAIALASKMEEQTVCAVTLAISALITALWNRGKS